MCSDCKPDQFVSFDDFVSDKRRKVTLRPEVRLSEGCAGHASSVCALSHIARHPAPSSDRPLVPLGAGMNDGSWRHSPSRCSLPAEAPDVEPLHRGGVQAVAEQDTGQPCEIGRRQGQPLEGIWCKFSARSSERLPPERYFKRHRRRRMHSRFVAVWRGTSLRLRS